MTTTATEQTIDIVKAFVSYNVIAISELPGLFTTTYAAVTALGEPAPPAGAPVPEPAVSIKASVKPDALICLCCGAKGKMLKRHLMTAHGLNPQGYRDMWGLPASYPMVAANYADKRRELAITHGLGRTPGAKVASRKKVA